MSGAVPWEGGSKGHATALCQKRPETTESGSTFPGKPSVVTAVAPDPVLMCWFVTEVRSLITDVRVRLTSAVTLAKLYTTSEPEFSLW